MTAAISDPWVLTRHRLRDDGAGTAALWVGYAAVVFLLVFAVAAFRPISVSGWEIGSQIPRWYVGAVGIYLTAVYLPLYVAHGFTRREAARQLTVAAVATVPMMAGFMTLGYVIERAIYGVAGWPQELSQAHLYDSATQYPLVFLEFLLVFTVWMAAGAFAGAAIYRNPANGLFAIPIGVAMIGVVEASLDATSFEFIFSFAGMLGVPSGVSGLAVTGIVFACLVLALPATWLLVRDLPLRSEGR